MKYLSRQEELVLLAVFRLKDESSLVKVREHLNGNTSKNWSISSVFVPLDRLEKSEYMKTVIGNPTAKRGGKAVKYYKITEKGLEALAEVKSVHDTMWDGLSGLVPGK